MKIRKLIAGNTRSTDTVILLPVPITRARLTAFGCALGLLSGVLVAVLTAWLIAPVWSWIGLVAVGGWCAAALGSPERLRVVYRWWNRAVRFLARKAADWVLRVTFFVLFLAVGRTPHRLVLDQPAENSLWHGRSALPPHFESQFVPPGSHTQAAASNGYVGWALSTGHHWALLLAPLLTLLRWLDTDQNQGFPVNIYTLY